MIFKRHILQLVILQFIILSCSELPDVSKSRAIERKTPELDSSVLADTTTFFSYENKVHKNSDIKGEEDILGVMNEIINIINTRSFGKEFKNAGKKTNELLNNLARNIILKHGFESSLQYESALENYRKSPDFKHLTDSLKSIAHSRIYKLKYSKD